MPVHPSDLPAFAVFADDFIHRVVKSFAKRAFRVGKFYHFDFGVGIAPNVVGGRNSFDIVFFGIFVPYCLSYARLFGALFPPLPLLK